MRAFGGGTGGLDHPNVSAEESAELGCVVELQAPEQIFGLLEQEFRSHHVLAEPASGDLDFPPCIDWRDEFHVPPIGTDDDAELVALQRRASRNSDDVGSVYQSVYTVLVVNAPDKAFVSEVNQFNLPWVSNVSACNQALTGCCLDLLKRQSETIYNKVFEVKSRPGPGVRSGRGVRPGRKKRPCLVT